MSLDLNSLWEKNWTHNILFRGESPASMCGTGTPGGHLDVLTPTKGSHLCVAQLFQMGEDTDSS